MDRPEVIKELQNLKDAYQSDLKIAHGALAYNFRRRITALEFAIDSLEVDEHYNLVYETMRESTPEEQETLKKAIEDNAYTVGVTYDGVMSHENYVPMGKVKALRAEIEAYCNDQLYENEHISDYAILSLFDKYFGDSKNG